MTNGLYLSLDERRGAQVNCTRRRPLSLAASGPEAR